MSSTRNRNRDAAFFWVGSAALGGSLLFVWQGLDFTDMGFWLTGYHDFYTHPDTMGSRAVCWLTYFICHWAGVALGGGVLAYKLGYAVVVTASAIISYGLLAFRFGPGRLPAATVLLAVFFTRGFAGNWIGYNELTALFYLCGAALLFRGLVGSRKPWVALAGVVLGANVFVRLPNLPGLFLVSGVWLYAVALRWSARELLIWSAWFLVGFALGMASVFCLMALNGHAHLYFQNMTALFGSAPGDNAPDSASGALKRLLPDHLRAFRLALPVVLFGCGLAAWAGRQRTLLASSIVAAGSLMLWRALYQNDNWRWMVPGLCYIVLLVAVARAWRTDPGLSLLAFIAGLVLFLAPLGSNNGIANAVFGMWLALPLTLILLWKSADVAIGKISMRSAEFRLFAVALSVALALQSLAWAWRHTYRDNQNRLAMTHALNHPLLGGVFTTAERAKVVAEVLEAISHFARPGDEVLVYNSIPLIPYLTGTHPWLGDPWPDLGGPQKATALIRQKEQAGAKLPCIVRAKRNTEADSWPTATDPPPAYWRQDETHRVFADFERRHGYAVAWTNDFFEILTPPP